MSKEKTRAELRAEVDRLKDDLQVTDGNLQNATIAHRELKEKYDALEKDRDEYRKESIEWQTKWDKLYKEKENESAYLNKALKLSGEANDKLIQERDAAKARIERMQADLDKAQYIAADLLDHGVFHFLIVKYHNLRAK